MPRIALVLLFFARSCALDDGTLFARLASAHGVTTRLALRQPAGGGPRGLVLDDGPAVGVGEPLLAVPLELCLIEKRDPPSASQALPWEARLALRLLDALDGRDHDGDGGLWQAYAPLLPRAGALANPQLLPDALLDRLGDATAADAAREQRARLRTLFGDVDADDDARRQWAWALVRSRTLAMRRGGGSTFDSFALVPFVDMANHGDGAGFGTHAARAARFAWPPLPNTDFRVERGLTPSVVFRALAPLAPGDEVLLRYGDELSARHVFARYGFARAATMAHEVFARALSDSFSDSETSFARAHGTLFLNLSPQVVALAGAGLARARVDATIAALAAAAPDDDDGAAPRAHAAARAHSRARAVAGSLRAACCGDADTARDNAGEGARAREALASLEELAERELGSDDAAAVLGDVPEALRRRAAAATHGTDDSDEAYRSRAVEEYRAERALLWAMLARALREHAARSESDLGVR